MSKAGSLSAGSQEATFGDGAVHGAEVLANAGPFDSVALSEELRRFWLAGPAPAYLVFGSSAAASPPGSQERLAELAVHALMVAGLRGVVVCEQAMLRRLRFEGHLDGERMLAYAASSVLFVSAAPHAWLFANCAVIAHHGGPDTTMLALRSGRPSIVIPFQPGRHEVIQLAKSSGFSIILRAIDSVTPVELAAALLRATGPEAMVEKAQAFAEKSKAAKSTMRALDCLISQELVPQRPVQQVSFWRRAAQLCSPTHKALVSATATVAEIACEVHMLKVRSCEGRARCAPALGGGCSDPDLLSKRRRRKRASTVPAPASFDAEAC